MDIPTKEKLMDDLRTLALSGKLAQNAELFKGKLDSLAGDYAMEPKYDGWRIHAFVGDGHVELFSRNGHTYHGQLPHIEAELLANFPAGTVIDGEAVALTMEDGKVTTWGTVQSVMTTHGGHAAQAKVSYAVFDLIAHAGIDARALGFADRRILLERIFDAGDFSAVVLTPQFEPSADAHGAMLKAGFEGTVCKRLTARYAAGKREGAGWVKIKPRISIDVVIMGFTPGKNGNAGLVGSIIFGQHDPDTGELVERGRCDGFDMRTRVDMTNHPEKWLGKVVEVMHEGKDISGSGDGGFRFPKVKRVRKDRTAESVVIHDA